MLYLYHSDAGQSTLHLEGDEHRYIFKVRRHKVDETLYLRNLKDGLLHRYLISTLDKKYKAIKLANIVNPEIHKVLKSAFVKISIVQILLVLIMTVLMILKSKGIVNI